MPDRDNADFGRGQSVADACKGTRIPRELREAPNPRYLPGAGEGSSDLATPFHPSGDGSPGAPDGGGHGSGPPVHRGARHQQGAWRPTGARVLRLRPASRPVRGRSGRSGRMVVSRRRAELRLRSLGRFARHLTIEDVTGQALAAPTRCYDGTTPASRFAMNQLGDIRPNLVKAIGPVRRRGSAQAASWSAKKLSGGSASSGVNRGSKRNRVPQ